MTIISLHPLVHNKQHLQLCALPTINNLIQAPPRILSPGRGHDNDEINSIRTSSNSTPSTRIIALGDSPSSDKFSFSLYQQTSSCYQCATKAELDMIADQMTLRERNAYKADNISSATQEAESERVNWMVGLWSNHRTPITGNYSFEVLETALSKRQINLQWFQPNNNTASTKNDKEEEENITIGYVVNCLNVNYKKAYSIRSLAMSLVPFLSTGRHWFSITRVRTVENFNNTPHEKDDEKLVSMMTKTTIEVVEDPNICDDGNNSGNTTDSTSSSTKWYLLDSNLETPIELNDSELANLLKHMIQEEGATVFRATIKASSLKQVGSSSQFA